MDRTSVFVDVESLNVLFMLDSKFVAALSYRNNVERLSQTLASMPAGYDVYLCMKPLPASIAGESFPMLAYKGVEFRANTEEFRKTLQFFSSSIGLNELYVCNWIGNFISVARVKSFKSAIYYGKYIADLCVKEGQLDSFRWFKSQKEFEDEVGDHASYYGDVGLVDTDGFIAHHPELSRVSKARLSALAPLAACYSADVKVPASDLLPLLESSEPAVPVTQTHTELSAFSGPSEPAVSVEDESQEPAVFGEDAESATHVQGAPIVNGRENPEFAVKTKVSIVAKLLAAVACVLSVTFGAIFGVTNMYTDTRDITSTTEAMLARVAHMKVANMVFSVWNTGEFELDDLYSYVSNYEDGVVLQGVDYMFGTYTLRYAIPQDKAPAFEEYLRTEYPNCNISEVGMTIVGGSELCQYSATVH